MTEKRAKKPPFSDLANAVRVLSMDAVQRARSGHPGMPMGMAEIATVLWREYLRCDPAHPQWPGRDRFVLSNGHGSMLLYSLLYLSGHPLALRDLKNFRQLGSKTPGHPEYDPALGVECTTGPLGQGLACAVGMALAEKVLSARFADGGDSPLSHHTYVFAGDGCLMEGVSHEACSLAGTLGLGRLIVFYDDNGISIDGNVSGWFTDDTPGRFASYNWQVIDGVDGHDEKQIRRAIEQARAERQKPTLICCKTVIGCGAPNKQGSAAVHGSPLGEAEVEAARESLDWGYPPFAIPEPVLKAWNLQARGRELHAKWQKGMKEYLAKNPDRAAELKRRLKGDLPADFDEMAQNFIRACAREGENVATRMASVQCLNQYASHLPEMMGGSADLTGSNNTRWEHSVTFNDDTPDANYLHYGVREFAMTAMQNGLALHGGFIPYGGTFLVFSDYARNAVRLAAMMKLRNIFVYTHDSIGLGEDGPTHQPVEHLAGLRLIPGLHVWRPADKTETAAAWHAALRRREGPTALVLTRQRVDAVPRRPEQVAAISRGAYILHEPAVPPRAILLATGSELRLALSAARDLCEKDIPVRVVAMPCAEVFDAQERKYRDKVLPPAVRVRVAVEASHGDWWRKYTGLDGAVLGLNVFGASAPGEKLMEHFGFTAAGVEKKVVDALRANASPGKPGGDGCPVKKPARG